MNILICLVANISVLFSCKSEDKSLLHQHNIVAKKSIDTVKYFQPHQSDTVIQGHYGSLKVPITIKFSDSAKRNLLVLPGWNYPDTQWCEKTKLCSTALKKGFNLIFVEMQRSVYLKEYYPETRKDYKNFPTRSWLMDSAFKPLFKENILNDSLPTFVLGLSTGGRGSALVALENPGIFKGAATLSGDFNPLLQKNDPLMILSIGSYQKNPKRWEADNNITLRVKDLNVPIYIGHGKDDKVCPIIQSQDFEQKIKENNPKLKVKSNYPKGMGHNYSYWNSEIDNVLNFFLEIN